MPTNQTVSRQKQGLASSLRQAPGRLEVQFSAFVVIALVTLGLTLWGAVVFRHDAPMLGIEMVGRGYVYHPPDGPALDAGLTEGDEILRLDDVPLRERFFLAGEKRAGDELLVTYRRDHLHRETLIVLAPLSGDEYAVALERLILALLFWMIATVVWLLRPAEIPAQRFFLFSQVMAAYLSVESLDLLIVPATVASDVLRVLIVPSLASFLVLFPTPLPSPWHRRLPAAAFGVVGLLLIGYSLHLVVPAATISSLGYWQMARVVDIAILVGALVALLMPQRIRDLAGLRRRRAVLFGMVIGILPTLLLTITARAVLGEPVLDYVWTFPFVAFIPASFALAVYAGELGHIDWILNRTLVYVLLTTALLCIYATAFFGLSRYFLNSPAWAFAVAGTALALVAAMLFRPAHTALQHRVDRLLYGGWYDYRTFIESATSDLAGIGDIDTLLDRLEEAIASMRRRAFGILMPVDDRFVWARAVGFTPLQQQLTVPAEGELVRRMESRAEPLRTSELHVHDAAQMEALATFDSHRWIPMVSRGLLRGIIVVREDPDDRLPPEDLAILSTLSRQAAVACENVALLRSLRERLEQVQRMNDELRETRFRLAAGREQERLHLARELHDGPVQDLYVVMHLVESMSEPSSSSVLRQEAGRLRESLTGVAEMIREICQELRPPLLTDFGLDAALREYVEGFQEKYPHLRLTLQIATGNQPVSEQIGAAFYRICQEALRNVAQHAEATNVLVRLEADAERTVLHIRDDGKGFEVPRKLIELGRRGHLGLLGMGERAEAVGGHLTVDARPGQGTLVRVVVPSQNPVDEPAEDP